MPTAKLHPEYISPTGSEGSRWNWFQSEDVTWPNGSVSKGHRHPNGGGWVADSATVSPSVVVHPIGVVFDEAVVVGDVEIFDFAAVFGNARVFGSAKVGEGSGFQKVYQDGQVFGEVTWLSGQGEVYPIGADAARAFGKVIIEADVGLIEGIDKGDAYGEYNAITDPSYLDVFYPSKPQLHGTLDPIARTTGLQLRAGESSLTWSAGDYSDIIAKNGRDGF